MAKILEAGANRATDSEAASFVDEFDRLERDREDQIRKLEADFKAKKRAVNAKINEDQKSILTDAKKVGVKKGVIRALADPNKRVRKATRELERAQEKAEEAIDALEPEDRDYAVGIREALGDDFSSFGLGASAVEREEGGDEDRDDDDTADASDPVAAAAQAAWDAEAGAPATH